MLQEQVGGSSLWLFGGSWLGTIVRVYRMDGSVLAFQIQACPP